MTSDNSSSAKLIAEMRASFGREGPAPDQEVPKSRVLEWMGCPNLNVRGALYSLITDAACARLVKPALEFDDYYAFVLDYLEQCIERNPEGEWVESRYLAGHQLVAWIVDFWGNEAVPRSKLAAIKSRLAELYKRGDEDIRDAVVNGVLEHLFENRSLAKYFRDWEADPILASAYSDAMLWDKKPGS